MKSNRGRRSLPPISYGYVSGPATLSGKKFNGTLMSRCLTLNPINEVVYIAYGSPGDLGPYNGWIVGYGAVKDASNKLPLKAWWTSTPNGTPDVNGVGSGAAGIWQGGGGIAVDGAGNLYVETANGTFDTALITAPYSARLGAVPSKVPNGGDYGNSFVKLIPDADTTQKADNPNGFGLHVGDYFTPKDVQALNPGDTDLGSSSPVLLPDSVGSLAHRHLLIGNGKRGIIYLLDRDNMGGYGGDAAGMGAGTNKVVQESIRTATGAWSTAAFYAGASSNSGTIYYATVQAGPTPGPGQIFTISNANITAGPKGNHNYYYPGSTPVVSANGSTNGIVWTVDRGVSGGSSFLVANDVAGFNNQLYVSPASGSDALTGRIMSFHTPMVANGRVYVGTINTLNAYGKR